MGKISDLVYCPNCGPQYKFSPVGVSWQAIIEMPITPEMAEKIIENNGIIYNCTGCKKEFKQMPKYSAEELRRIAQEP